MTSFSTWLLERKTRTGLGAAELVTLIARAGRDGISRRELAQMFTLPPRLLTQLLAAHCDVGLLQASSEGDETIYRAAPWLETLAL
jgi:hypothetical protein